MKRELQYRAVACREKRLRMCGTLLLSVTCERRETYQEPVKRLVVVSVVPVHDNGALSNLWRPNDRIVRVTSVCAALSCVVCRRMGSERLGD